MKSETFKKGLENGDLKLVAGVDKADLHSHGILAGRLFELENWLGRKLSPQPEKIYEFQHFEDYLGEIIGTAFSQKYEKDDPHGRKGFEFLFELAFRQAARDGVKVLEMSIDSNFGRFYDDEPEKLVSFFKRVSSEAAPETKFVPELGIARDQDLNRSMELLEKFAATGYFGAIDLYGDELAQDASLFKDLYRTAKKAGMKLKAHVGEYGDAESVRRTAEVLELEAIQHGIAAVQSEDVMKWLADNGIQLNVCPSSNVILHRVDEMKNHPIRKLFDNGVKVTVNSDDILVFNRSVSEEFLALYRAGLFSAEELDLIRINGIK